MRRIVEDDVGNLRMLFVLRSDVDRRVEGVWNVVHGFAVRRIHGGVVDAFFGLAGRVELFGGLLRRGQPTVVRRRLVQMRNVIHNFKAEGVSRIKRLKQSCV